MVKKIKKNFRATFINWRGLYVCRYVQQDSPMAERGDEIEAAVNSIVNNVSTIKAALIMEVALKLVIDVADNGAETAWEKIHYITVHCTETPSIWLKTLNLKSQKLR